MNKEIVVTGMVLSAGPIGENDRRLLLLTKERGKLSAFAKGARRPGSPLQGSSRPFAFGTIQLYEGRNSYTVRSMEIERYFDSLAEDMEAACYGSYFLEFAGYYGREGVEAGDMLRLLYAALLALERGAMPRPLVRAVFELRLMAGQGEYSEEPLIPVGEAARYAWQYILAETPGRLFSFTLTPESLRDLEKAVEDLKARYIDREFHSLEILKKMQDFL